jgi:hypothetical protein
MRVSLLPVMVVTLMRRKAQVLLLKAAEAKSWDMRRSLALAASASHQPMLDCASCIFPL